MNNAPRYNDRIITEGFPDGFHVQDRICQDAAILCRKGGLFGHHAICVRPRAMTTDDWLPDARRLANGYVLMTCDLPPTANPRVQALVEAVTIQAGLLNTGTTGPRGVVVGERLTAALSEFAKGDET